MHHFALASLAACFAFALPLTAQTTWVVDAAFGAGSHFTDFPAALNAASPGDIVIIRSGTYTPATVSKGIRILGEPGAKFETGAVFREVPLRIDSVPAGQTCVVDGLTVMGRSGVSVLVLADNKGNVVLSNLLVTYPSQTGGASLAVYRSASVHLSHSEVDMGAYCIHSNVSIVSSSFMRRSFAFMIGGSYPAIDIHASTVELAGVTATGQDGFLPYNSNSPAVRTQGSALRLLAGGSIFRAGADAKNSLPAVTGFQSSLELDPGVVLKPSGAAAPHSGFASVVTGRMPMLDTRGGALGGTLEVILESPASHSYALLVSLPTAPVDVLSFGKLWLDTAAVISVGQGVQTASERWSFKTAVPQLSALRGLPLTWQALSGQALSGQGSGPRLSNPAVSTLR